MVSSRRASSSVSVSTDMRLNSDAVRGLDLAAAAFDDDVVVSASPSWT